MKIITFQAGLGNQIFQYAYYLHLCKIFPNETFYGFYPKRALKAHNGLEICQWFDIELPKSTNISNFIAYTLFWINKLCWKLQIPHFLTDTDWFRKPNAMLYSGFWQDKQYFLELNNFSFKKDLILSETNKHILQKICATNSVAVHVRRGDYTNPKVQHIYGNICTLDYYNQAITIAKEKINKPEFFFFSDDPEYIEATFKNIKKTIITWNKGKDSFFDMYLMAHCKNMILANSTFSCWAAYLNKNQPLVICPQKWRNDRPTPPVILNNWITL